jgi:hypothetical protein
VDAEAAAAAAAVADPVVFRLELSLPRGWSAAAAAWSAPWHAFLSAYFLLTAVVLAARVARKQRCSCACSRRAG